MHCRPITSPDYFLTSSFLFPHSNPIPKFQSNLSSFSYHEQFQQRRRLEDPVLTYASNYYVTNPHQISHSPSSLCSSLPSFDQEIHRKNIYCDLCNLLERSSPIQSKKKHFFNYSKRTIVYEDDQINIKDRQQKSSPCKDKYHHQRSSNREVFRRVLRNYFCLPMTIFNGK